MPSNYSSFPRRGDGYDNGRSGYGGGRGGYDGGRGGYDSGRGGYDSGRGGHDSGYDCLELRVSEIQSSASMTELKEFFSGYGHLHKIIMDTRESGTIFTGTAYITYK